MRLARSKMAVDVKAVPQGAKPAVLLTEDANMHKEANDNRVPRTEFKEYIHTY